MKTFPAVLVFTVVLAAVSGSEAMSRGSKTYVSNWSTRQIRATVTFTGDNHKGDFENRLLEPYTYEAKEYVDINHFMKIEIWIEGSPSHGSLEVRSDRSIVAFDEGPNIDIYLVKYGKLTVIDDTETWKITTIYPG